MSEIYCQTERNTTYLVHLNNDIVSLTRVDVQGVSGIRQDGRVISADDGHLVVVEVDDIRSLGRRVDDAEEMLLASNNSPLRRLALGAIDGLVLAVEHVVDRRRERASETSNVPCHLEDGLREDLVNHDGAQVVVVVGS